MLQYLGPEQLDGFDAADTLNVAVALEGKAIQLTKNGFKKGRFYVDTEAVYKAIHDAKDFERLNKVQLVALLNAMNTAHKAALEEAEEGEETENDEKAPQWLQALHDWAKPMWSDVDNDIFDGLKVYTNPEGDNLLIARTGRGHEWKVICNGSRQFEALQGLSSSLHPSGDTYYERIQKVIVDSIMDICVESRPNQYDHPDVFKKLPASCFQHLISYRTKKIRRNVNGEMKSVTKYKTVLTTKKPSVEAYFNFALAAFMGNVKNRIFKMSDITTDPEEDSFRFIPVPETQGEFPNWTEWMGRFRDDEMRECFQMWLGSLFDEKNNGKQVLWLQGSGDDGKSVVCRALEKFWGSMYQAVNPQAMGDKHGMAYFEGKRLAVVGDNKNPKLIMTAWVHELTGGDRISVDAKGKAPRTAGNICKLMVCANCMPEIETERNQRSRLLLISMKQRTPDEEVKMGLRDNEGRWLGDGSFGPKLEAETEAFLGNCYAKYVKGVPNRSQIPISSVAEDKILGLGSVDMEAVEGWLETGVEEKEGWTTYMTEIYDAVADLDGIPKKILEDGYFKSKVKRLLTERYPNAEVKKARIAGQPPRSVIIGIKIK
jgi:hypothetical protein